MIFSQILLKFSIFQNSSVRMISTVDISNSPVLQAIMKYRNHPSINTILRFSQYNSSFYFSPVDKNTVIKELKGLGGNKAVQDNDIPAKNANFFAEQITL